MKKGLPCKAQCGRDGGALAPPSGHLKCLFLRPGSSGSLVLVNAVTHGERQSQGVTMAPVDLGCVCW